MLSRAGLVHWIFLGPWSRVVTTPLILPSSSPALLFAPQKHYNTGLMFFVFVAFRRKSKM